MAKGGSVRAFPVGDAMVWAIADISGTRDTSGFPEADAAALAKYVPDGVYRNAVMTFAIRTGGKLVLVDAGYGNLALDRPSHLMEGLATAGIDPLEVDTVLLTHLHLDHFGGLLWEGEKTFPNAKVLSSRDEQAFWLDSANRAKHPHLDSWFDLAKQYLDAYSPAVGMFDYGDEVAPGIVAVENGGHTPGQAGFLLESAGERLYIWGDIIHAAALQFPRPDINSVHDMDPARSRAVRRQCMTKLAEEATLLAGMHLPFPGVGLVEKTEEGGFVFRAGEGMALK